MKTQAEDREMTLIKVRRAGQITLPASIREALNAREGDYLQVEVTSEGAFLKPLASLDRAKAWEQVFRAIEGVRYSGPEPEPSEAEVLEMANEAVHAYRKKQHEGGSR